MLRNFVKTALRNISRNKSYTFINVLGLSVGICAALIIYFITSYELNYDRKQPDAERIYRIVGVVQNNQGKIDYTSGCINPLPDAIKQELSGLEQVARFHNYYASVSIPNGSNEPRRFDAARRGETASPIIITSSSYFDLFKYQWLEGNPAISMNNPFTVVLAESQALRYFGNIPVENMIGRDLFYKDIYFADSLHVTVSGIVKDRAQPSDFGFTDFISQNTIPSSFLKNMINFDSWGNWNPSTQGFIKISSSASKEQVEKQLPKFIQAHIPPHPGFSIRLLLQPFRDIHFNALFHDSYSRQAHLPTLYAMMAIATFILIVAAINFINLSTAQSLFRMKEIGVRKVLGSSRQRLTIQFMLETFVLTLISVLIAILLSFPVMSMFHSMMPPGIQSQLFSASTFIFLLLITMVTALLAGFYPARVLSGFEPVSSLKGQASGKTGDHQAFRKALIVFQFTLSLIFIISSLVIGHQIRFIQNRDLGINSDAVISIKTGFNHNASQVSLFAEKIKAIPSVQAVSTHLETPIAISHSRTHINYADISVDAQYEMSDEQYLSVFGIKILVGRNMFHSDTVREFLVNETCARGLGFSKIEEALGKTVKIGMNDQSGMIVGVINDFHSKSLHEPITAFFISSYKDYERTVSVKLAQPANAQAMKASISSIEHIWNSIYPGDKIEYRFLDESIAKLYTLEQQTAQLVNTAMIIAILISGLGLFGLATYTAHQRKKEMGIRKLLGASIAGIITLLSKEFLVLIAIALLIATPIAYYAMHIWLQDFTYKVTISWWVFILAGSSSILIALLSIGYHAVKSALANPIIALKE